MKPLIALILLYFSICNAHGFVVRDSQTGAPIDADVTVQSINKQALSAEQWHQIKLGYPIPNEVTIISQKQLQPINHLFRLAPNKYLQVLHIAAPGYQSMQTHITPHSHITMTYIMLDQVNTVKKQPSPCDYSQLCGFLYDQTTTQPLQAVKVNINSDQFTAQIETNANGAFVYSEPLPNNINITIRHPGFQSKQWTDIDTQSAIRMIIDLQRGSGLNTKRMAHPLTGIATDAVDPDWLNAKSKQTPSSSDSFTKERPTGAVFLEPPASIKVGFDASGGYCCGSNCATSQVFSLETYVQRGLDDEWISFWEADSLKAGSIPFRSYGAWHVINEVYSGYDICAGPCCQAFEYTGYTSTIDAAIATNGIMLDQNGAIARSEYSAQNNSWDAPNDGLNCTNADLSCGDGAVGSPATGWSCLSDPLSTGLGCFGHGRGMSQWGTQFRAQDGETFADIIDTYYNANNNPAGQRNQYASTPVRIDSISINETAIPELDSLTIDYNVFNASDDTQPFGPVLLGASLFDGNTYFSDPSNDLSLIINQAGNTVLQRPFQLDTSIQPGDYELITALYLDVDNDGLISSFDWLLQVQTFSDVVNVLAKNDLIFRSSF